MAGHTPTQTGLAAELHPSERYCTICKKALRGRFAWLERDCISGECRDGGIAPERSQGWFPVGMTCARAAIAKAEDSSPSLKSLGMIEAQGRK